MATEAREAELLQQPAQAHGLVVVDPKLDERDARRVRAWFWRVEEGNRVEDAGGGLAAAALRRSA